MKKLVHDPADQLKAMDLARAYGTELYTGVFYKNPNPPLPLEELIKLRQAEESKKARPRNRILDAYLQK